MPKPKRPEVKSERVWFRPTAYCQGVLEVNPEKYGHDTAEVVVRCNAQFSPAAGFMPDSRSASDWARRHAAHHPGHQVHWERREVAVYYTDAPEEASS